MRASNRANKSGRLAARTVTAGLTAAGFAAGCRDATSPPPQAAGTYALRSVGGQPLPVVVIRDSLATTAVLADTLTLRADGTLAERVVQRTTAAAGSPPPADQRVAHTGTWSLSGSTLAVRLDPGLPLAGTFSSGHTLAVSRQTALGPNGALTEATFEYAR